MPRAIAMSPVHLAEWKQKLTEKEIVNAADLWNRVNVAEKKKDKDDITPTTAEKEKDIAPGTTTKAFKGERIDRKSWSRIFEALELDRTYFFTDAEWNKWDAATLWGMLLYQAEDASDRFGMIFPDKPQLSGIGDIFETEDTLKQQRIQRSLPSGKSVLLEIPEGLSGYLILLEQCPSGKIVLVAPSCLMKDPLLTSKARLLPQYPPSPMPFVKPTTLGTSHLWAGIFAKLPDWDWLHEERRGLLKLELAHISQLLEYAETQPRATTQFWKSSYVVTAD
jgi:hypothetical protein